jgi:hypothetical protein
VSDTRPAATTGNPADGVAVTEESLKAAALLEGGYGLKSIREDALRPFAVAPYEALRATCRRLQYERVPAEGPLLDVLAGFCFQEGLHYAGSCCQTARRDPRIRPDLYGVFSQMSAFQRYLRRIAGSPERVGAADLWEDRFKVEHSFKRGQEQQRDERVMTRAEACEAFPVLAEYLSPAARGTNDDGFGYGDAQVFFWVGPAAEQGSSDGQAE